MEPPANPIVLSMSQARIYNNMRIIRWTGTPGGRRLWRDPAGKISPFFSAWATPPAIGAMLWPMNVLKILP